MRGVKQSSGMYSDSTGLLQGLQGKYSPTLEPCFFLTRCVWGCSRETQGLHVTTPPGHLPSGAGGIFLIHPGSVVLLRCSGRVVHIVDTANPA